MDKRQKMEKKVRKLAEDVMKDFPIVSNVLSTLIGAVMTNREKVLVEYTRNFAEGELQKLRDIRDITTDGSIPKELQSNKGN